MPQTRQLAAIMFTDIVGYTALMGEDEQKAFELLNINREIHKPLIEQFEGRWIKEMGDGIMASFNTVSDAVNAAIKIQEACNGEKHFQLRIGIHLGDLVFENNDVFGDGVNIASRIQALAFPGSIYVSEPVHHIISNKKNFKTNFVREELLKNVKDPVRIYEIVAAAIAKPNLPVNKISAPIIKKSLAILPFTDMSPARDQEYLGDGLAEELMNILSQSNELKVIGRTSSFSFKGTTTDLKTIGEKLDAETILEGSIQKSGNRFRITAQLINAVDGFHIWSQRYDRQMDDIFALQDDICTKISEHLKITLLAVHETAVETRPTQNLQAYDCYLKGDYYYNKYTQAGFEKAVEFFTRAVELDPAYADAWWYLGFANFEMHGWLLLSKERLETANYCVRKALDLDETNADAHFFLSLIHFNYGYEWDIVESELTLGNKYTNTPFPLRFLPLEAWTRAMLHGDLDFAIKRLQSGVESDPLNWYYQFHLAQIYLFAVRDYAKTRSILENVLELGFPESSTWRPICLSYLFESNYLMAEEFARRDYNASNGKGHGAANLVMCLAAADRRQEAMELYQLAKKLTKYEFPALLHVKVNAYLGNPDEAFIYLDKALAESDYWLFALKYSPEFDLLRPDPRFEKVLKRMNFP